MRIPLSWLKEYLDVDLNPSQIAKIMTMAGLEVESVEEISAGCSQVVVAKVLEVQKHPGADKLCLATVTDGKETYQVVCGASNCRAGLKTALATVGATVVGDKGEVFTIKKSKIRGVESSGMLCSPQEIGLKDPFEGIIEFSEYLKEGTDVAHLYADTLFEIGLTPNLGHCASLLGVARELSAATNRPVKYPTIVIQENSPLSTKELFSVEVLNTERCPRYACRAMKNVRVGPSPDWLQKRLEACGVRSINNIVDATNYVMLEMGHPLHAFDADLLTGGKIVVRNAKQGEKFVTLDGKERTLESTDLLICDQEKPVALAGIMGGMNSEVQENTKNLLIEAACFHPGTIRKTSKRLGLISDASKRFERGCDPNILSKVLDRTAALIQQIAGGEICKGIIDVASQPFPKKQIACRLSRVNRVLGTHLSVSEVENVFNRLEFQTVWDGQDVFTVNVPTYRNDIREEIDLVEEVARIYGFENIEIKSPLHHSSQIPHAPIFLFEREMRSQLLNAGLQEFLTSDLIGPSMLEVVQEVEMSKKLWVRVLNPTSIEQSILRTSLFAGLLHAVKYNWDHQNCDIAAFEVGRIHFKEGDHYREQSVAGIVLSGQSHPHHWDEKARPFDFFDLKGILENLLNAFSIADISFKDTQLEAFHPGRQASIFAGHVEIGSIGEVHPAILRRLDVPQRIYFAEVNLHDLFGLKAVHSQMRELPLYPCSERDWTVTIDENLPIEEIFKAIQGAASLILESVSLWDVYRSDKLGLGKQNVTFHFVYRDKEKTLAQETVDTEHARLTGHVLKSIEKLG